MPSEDQSAAVVTIRRNDVAVSVVATVVSRGPVVDRADALDPRFNNADLSVAGVIVNALESRTRRQRHWFEELGP